MILATDMARSKEDLEMFMQLIDDSGVKEGNSPECMVDKSTALTQFNSQ